MCRRNKKVAQDETTSTSSPGFIAELFDCKKAQISAHLRKKMLFNLLVHSTEQQVICQQINVRAEKNGQLVSDHVLAPGWTSYNHRLYYQTFDVTNLLSSGSNAIGAILGDGWYRGRS
jgi:alpha-L-rhamnosidase